MGHVDTLLQGWPLCNIDFLALLSPLFIIAHGKMFWRYPQDLGNAISLTSVFIDGQQVLGAHHRGTLILG